jgi:CheY-like chemotaxis protein
MSVTAAGAATSPSPQSGSPRRVLLIDDDVSFTLLAGETLQQAGFAVEIANNSREALSAFEAHRPDVVLLDVELPGTNGFDLCSTLRALSPGYDVPIVMVTGHDDTASIARAYEAGATDFIHKPVLWPTLPPRIGFILRAQDNLRALQQSEQKNRALLQALPDAIYIVDRNGLLCEHITGNAKQGPSLVGQPWKQYYRRMWRAAPARLSPAAAAAVPPRSSTSSAEARNSAPSKRVCGHSRTATC